MQQYYTVDAPVLTLTIFHTEDSVSFDAEHFGGYSIDDTRLKSFLTGDETELKVFFRPEEDATRRYRAGMFDKDEYQVGMLTKNEDGSLDVHINQTEFKSNGRPVTVTLTSEQATTLCNSITVGTVDRYDDPEMVSYPVESVDEDGVRDRAER